MQAAIPLSPTQHGDRLAFKGMALSRDDYLFRKSLMVGSLSTDRSTPFHTVS
jgi:hypothetical protein